MTNLRASEDHYSRVQRVSALTLAALRRYWQQVNLANLDESWARVGADMYLTLSAAQLAAAQSAKVYVPAVLAEQGIDVDPVAEFIPRSLVGVSADGRPLESLLYSPFAATKSAVANRAIDPFAVGLSSLTRISMTEVADAGRQATVVEQATRPTVTYYTRMLNPPSCSRCAILAGKVFKDNAGFQRHPQCDCVHVPTREDIAGDLTTDPKAYFNSLSKAEQDAIFTKSGAQAIRDGADMSQVVNARRGMRSVAQNARNSAWGKWPVRRTFGAQTTIEGVTPRAFATTAPGSSVTRRGGVRLMPEAIYDVATSREDVLRLLRANGYVR